MKEILQGISDFVNSCLGPLGSGGQYGWPDWMRDFLVQLAAFIILILVVRIFLWKPITAFLAKKAAATDGALEEAKAKRQEAQELSDELQARLDNASEEIKALILKATEEGNRKREEIINEAKEEAQRRIDAAENQIALEIKKKREDIKQEIVDIAFLAASKIAEKEVDQKQYLKLVENIIESGLTDE